MLKIRNTLWSWHDIYMNTISIDQADAMKSQLPLFVSWIKHHWAECLLPNRWVSPPWETVRSCPCWNILVLGGVISSCGFIAPVVWNAPRAIKAYLIMIRIKVITSDLPGTLDPHVRRIFHGSSATTTMAKNDKGDIQCSCRTQQRGKKHMQAKMQACKRQVLVAH